MRGGTAGAGSVGMGAGRGAVAASCAGEAQQGREVSARMGRRW
jgi:hypothetical protein